MKNINVKQTNSFQSLPTHYRQQGFTLVEIMVALAIGLLMMAGILQISAASKESARLQRNMSFVQENIRTSMEILGRDIRMAGHYTDNNPAARILTSFTPFIAATTTDGGFSAGVGELNDEITVTYESNTDCLGQATPTVAGNRFAVNHYFIDNERLMCRGNGNATAQPIVEGVENMQILYGENTDGDARSSNRYVKPADPLNAANTADLDNVVSVRIAMRFHSREGVRSAADNNLYALLDAVPTLPAAGDKRIRRQVTTTISLRNQLRK